MNTQKSGASMDDWDAWQSAWREAGGAAASRTATESALRRMRLVLFLTPIIEGAIAIAALVTTAGALMHAPNVPQLMLGLLVSGGIVLVWTRRVVTRWREHAAAAEVSARYLRVLRGAREEQRRLANFLSIVLALEVGFLVPFWMRGSAMHPRTLTNPDSWIGMYLPIALIAALFVWSYWLRRRSRAEVAALTAGLADYEHAIESGDPAQ